MNDSSCEWEQERTSRYWSSNFMPKSCRGMLSPLETVASVGVSGSEIDRVSNIGAA